MKLGRILCSAFGSEFPRLVAVLPEYHQVLDLATAEYIRLRKTGATSQASQRLASVLFSESMSASIGAGPLFLDEIKRCIEFLPSEALLDMQTVTWLPPLDPPIMRDCLAFEQHLINASKGRGVPVPDVYYEIPVYYKGNPLTLIGHEQEVPWPVYTEHLDYELEMGFVVGREGANLIPQEARSYLFGVTIFNDFSARDMQRKEGAGLLGPAKGKDFATGLGPWIVTADELNVHDLTLIARVNGEEWSRGSSSALMWKPEEILAYISTAEGLHPGELIGSGTVGFGCGLELGRKLQPGDVVELEIEGIGILRNHIGKPQQQGWMPTHAITRKN